jgi:hypothetical protein
MLARVGRGTDYSVELLAPICAVVGASDVPALDFILSRPCGLRIIL